MMLDSPHTASLKPRLRNPGLKRTFEERDLEGGALHVDAVIDHGLEEVRLDLHIYVCFYHLHTHTHTHTNTREDGEHEQHVDLDGGRLH